ncbi:MAG: hypothetical protein B6I26_01305, partial [Desulfobacteraceae bacterium 4572_130]
MERFKKIIIIFLSIAFMFTGACSDGDSGDTISGDVVAAMVNKATVKAYKINPDGSTNDQIGGENISTNGSYSISNLDYTGAVLLEASGGTYTDEATGNENTALTTLTAIAYIDSLTAIISITPLTHIAAQLMDRAAADIKTEIKNKNELVAEQFGLMQTSDNTNTNPIDIISVQPDDITDETVKNKPLDDKKLYALALAGISQNQENEVAVNTLEKIIPVLMNDLKNNSELSETYQKSFSAGVSGYITDKQIEIKNDSGSIPNPIINKIIKNNVANPGNLPTANAGEDTTIIEKGRSINLDGSASRTYNNTTSLSYEWILIKPNDSNAQLSSDNTSATKLTSGTNDPVGTRYVVTLKVIDTNQTDDEYFHVASIAIEVKKAPDFDCTMDVTIPTTINENTQYNFDAPTFSGPDKDNKIGNWTYTITPDAAPFSVDSSTGVITMTPIDYEAGTTTYTVTLTATDDAAHVIDKTLTITITNLVDETPVLDEPGADFTVSEDAAVGFVLGSLTISTNDENTSDTAITLTGTGNGNFEVINDSGTWNIKVKAGATLDFETTQSYNLKAEVSNDTLTSNQVDVVIDVTNVVDTTPTLTQPSSAYTVLENAATGAIVGELVISDNDDIASNTSIALTGSGNENFEVINDSGTWNLKVKAGASLDFETTESYALKAQANNTAGTGNEVDVTINVTNVVDTTPTLTQPSS